MFEMSFATAIVIIALLVVFRSNLKQVQKVLPEVASNITTPVLRGANQLDLIVATNCNENTIDLAKRSSEVLHQLKELELNDIKEAEALIRGIK